MKQGLLCFILIGLIFTGCDSKSEELHMQSANTGVGVKINSVEKPNIEEYREIENVVDKTDEWSQRLISEGNLNIDINEDGIEDSISMKLDDVEGAFTISEFRLLISGMKKEYIMKEYDATFVKLLVADIDLDSNNEILLLFDTHGGGGQGTHDLYLIQDKSNGYEVQLLSNNIKDSQKIDEKWTVDGIYDIEKILYNGEEKILTVQYVWGDSGHSDEKGYIKTIVYLKNKNLYAEESWFEPIK